MFVQVNNKAAGKTALHCASVSGNEDMVKVILEHNPELEVAVSDNHLHSFFADSFLIMFILSFPIHSLILLSCCCFLFVLG